jgi:hypothetical protein
VVGGANETALRWAWAQPDLSSPAKALLVELASVANADGWITDPCRARDLLFPGGPKVHPALGELTAKGVLAGLSGQFRLAVTSTRTAFAHG